MQAYTMPYTDVERKNPANPAGGRGGMMTIFEFLNNLKLSGWLWFLLIMLLLLKRL